MILGNSCLQLTIKRTILGSEVPILFKTSFESSWETLGHPGGEFV